MARRTAEPRLPQAERLHRGTGRPTDNAEGKHPWRAFDGVRVLELGQIYNGPYCGLLFAQLGAEVIKVEPPGGEPLRFRSHDPVESHEFVMLNSNKRSVVLDLKTDAGRQALLDLVETADVLIENFAPGTMERLQLGPERLLAHNPRLVVASGKGYGIHRPLRPHVRHGHHRAGDVRRRLGHRGARRAADQGRCRVRRLLRRHPPVRGDHGGPVPARAHRTGADRRGVDARHHLPDAGLEPGRAAQQPRASSSPNAPGTGTRAWRSRRTTSTRRATDGWRSSASSERHWHGVATALGRPELIDDPRFRTAKDRVANIDAVDEEVSSLTRTRTRDELVRDLQAAGVPCAPVKSIREVDTDEHLIERGMIQYVEHPGRGRVPVPGCPLRLSDSPVGQLQAAPPLGQSTEEILAELAPPAPMRPTKPASTHP